MENPAPPPVPSAYPSGRPNVSGRLATERQLLDLNLGFSAAYMAVQYLSTQIESFPGTLTSQTFQALLSLAQSRQFESRKQAFFLYRDIFSAMVRMALIPEKGFAGRIIPRLQELLLSSTGPKKRAVAHALSTLPVCLDRPDPLLRETVCLFPLSFTGLLDEFTRKTGISPDYSRSAWQGRSLVLRLDPELRAVIKLARSRTNIQELAQEALWMNYLSRISLCANQKFYVPAPIQIQGNFVFRLNEIPEFEDPEHFIAKNPIAIAYLVHREYFDYPSHPGFHENRDSIREIFSRNAMLLGTLTGMGVIHTALIPLFHNRIQRERRRDRGVYRWEHGGRLDQWLESCRYPNFAQSGIRDFEHLFLLTDPRDLGHYIGEHMLSFILVMGSLFRNMDPGLRGLDGRGSPADARALFDPDLFSDLIHEVATSYYLAITGEPLKFALPVKHLVCRLIHGMGIDEHMEERLRVEDQERMTDPKFHEFLKTRGIEDPKIFSRAKEEIVLVTGPHLGGFNQPISVPELIDFLFTFSAMCVSGRYLKETRP